ncbi:MAG: hypothetical protein M3442_17195 [Chloroflexota bacterium]|nr:hypothetical protein [Chloroflexota bacterium]
MTDQHTATETALRPEETDRLLAAVRRAHEDAAAGRVYRLGEDALLALAGVTAAAGRPLTREEVDAWVCQQVAEGAIEALPGAPAVAPVESSGPQ